MNIPISAAKPYKHQGKPAGPKESADRQPKSQELLPRRLLKLIGHAWQQQKKISWTPVLLCAGLIVAIAGAAHETKITLVQPLLYIQRLFEVPSKSAPAGINLPRLLPVIPRRDNVA